MKKTFLSFAVIIASLAQLNAVPGSMESLKTAIPPAALKSAAVPEPAGVSRAPGGTALGDSAPARRRENVKTILTCGKSDADFWLEVAIAGDTASGVNALIVAHNEDTGSARLTDRLPVSARQSDTKTIYEDDGGLLLLAVSSDSLGRLTADLTLARPGRGSIKEPGLLCRENSVISFDAR